MEQQDAAEKKHTAGLTHEQLVKLVAELRDRCSVVGFREDDDEGPASFFCQISWESLDYLGKHSTLKE